MTAIFLGTHKPTWLERLDVPLFISRRRLAERKRLPRARARWALDSGGFTELTLYGRWMLAAEDYVSEVRRYRDECGKLEWAAIQDWMCEPFMLARTGQDVREHQRRTVDSYLRLRDLAPELPWAPVLQGWEPADYWRCVELYQRAGVDLRAAPVVGLGSVCRRQHTAAAERLVRDLARAGLRLHGFGFKVLGLLRVHDVLVSSDSLAWSWDARHRPPLPECQHRRCANCARWALRWWERTTERVRRAAQRKQWDLFGEAP